MAPTTWDWAALGFLMVLAAIIAACLPQNSSWGILALSGLVGLVVGALTWWGGMTCLGKARIVEPMHRAVFLAGVIPVVCFGLVPFVIIAFLLVLHDYEQPWITLGLIVFEAALLASFIASASFTQFITERVAEPERDSQAVFLEHLVNADFEGIERLRPRRDRVGPR